MFRNFLDFIFVAISLFAIIACKSPQKNSTITSNKGIPVIIDPSFNVDNYNMRMNILNMHLNKDILTLEINYSGGCKQHEFNLYTTGAMVNNNVQLFLIDKQNEDFCKMLISDTLYFNIANLKTLNKNKLFITVNRNEQILQYP